MPSSSTLKKCFLSCSSPSVGRLELEASSGSLKLQGKALISYNMAPSGLKARTSQRLWSEARAGKKTRKRSVKSQRKSHRQKRE